MSREFSLFGLQKLKEDVGCVRRRIVMVPRWSPNPVLVWGGHVPSVGVGMTSSMTQPINAASYTYPPPLPITSLRVAFPQSSSSLPWPSTLPPPLHRPTTAASKPIPFRKEKFTFKTQLAHLGSAMMRLVNGVMLACCAVVVGVRVSNSISASHLPGKWCLVQVSIKHRFVEKEMESLLTGL